MGLGIFYVVAGTETDGREWADTWGDSVKSLIVTGVTCAGQIILEGEADCGMTVHCMDCDQLRCVGCGMLMSFDISGPAERWTCLSCWEPPDASVA